MKAGANNERVFRMAFASVYPHYVNKVERKGRTKEELHTVIRWLMGYTEKGLATVIDKKVDYETFFVKAPKLNPNVGLISQEGRRPSVGSARVPVTHRSARA